MGEQRRRVHHVEGSVGVRESVVCGVRAPGSAVRGIRHVGEGEAEVREPRGNLTSRELDLPRQYVQALVPSRRAEVVEQPQHRPTVIAGQLQDGRIPAQLAKQDQIRSILPWPTKEVHEWVSWPHPEMPRRNQGSPVRIRYGMAKQLQQHAEAGQQGGPGYEIADDCRQHSEARRSLRWYGAAAMRWLHSTGAASRP